MPPPDELLEEAQACLASIRLVRFSAESGTIRAGESTELRWEVDRRGCAPPTLGRIELNGVSVSASGSRAIRPVRTTSFLLIARARGLSRSLGRVQVQVDDSGCETSEIAEALVVPVIIDGIRDSINALNAEAEHKVRLRRDPVIEFEPSGVVIRLRMKLDINNFFDPDVDVDARVGIGVSAEGRALAFYKSFSVDVDWPWWVTGLSAGITKIVEEVLDGGVEGVVRPKILRDLTDKVNELIAGFGGVVSAIETAQDRVLVTHCST